MTGSAKLNVYRKGSDSLLGRYYHFRLHPFSLAELLKNREPLAPDLLLDELFNNTRKGTKRSGDVAFLYCDNAV